MTVVSIVRAEPADAAAIARLHAGSWRRTYAPWLPEGFDEDALYADRLASWTARFAEPPDSRDLVLKATEDGVLAGFVAVVWRAEGQHGPLLANLHVKPEFHRRGIGRRLLVAAAAAVSERADAMHLWVVSGNAGACRFYDAHGGSPRDTRSDELVPGASVDEIRYVWNADALARLRSTPGPSAAQ